MIVLAWISKVYAFVLHDLEQIGKGNLYFETFLDFISVTIL